LKRHFIHATFARTVAALAIMILLSVLVGALAVQAVHIPKFEIRNSKLVLSTVEASAASPPQPTSLTAFHRSGQTFVTWTERTDLSNERYHVYRHTSPITSASLAQATRLTQTWGALGEGSSIFWSERSREPPITPNYVIQNLGTPLSDTTGLFVWTTHEDGTFYYAVTTVQGGTENVTDFGPGNTAGPIAEAVADPQPVKVWQAAGGRGFVFTQYLDYSRYNPTFGVPQGGSAQQYAFNYGVTLPSDAACGGSLPASLPGNVYLEGWGGRYSNDDVTPWNYCVVFIVPDDPNQTWYYGHSASYDYRLGGTANSGPIVNFTEERILRAIYDTLRDPTFRLDPNRIYAYGHSMGGSGALALGMRYPNVFAATYSSEPMTNYQTSALWLSDTEWKWGTVTSNLPIETQAPNGWADHLARHNGTGVWDWQNHQQQLVSQRGDDMAHISLAHGTLDNVIAWSTQGQPAYEPFYLGRRAFSGATEAADHTWLGYSGLGPNVQDYNYTGPFYGWTAVRDESLPGLTYASGSSSVPPPGAGASYNLNLEWSASWYNWDGAPIDTADEWRISLRTLVLSVSEGSVGSTQTVDVTPRRLQTFHIVPADACAWENRRVGDNGLVASGTVIADAAGLITVPAFQVTSGGNRLILRPGTSGPTATPTSTPTPTATSQAATATPTPTPTPTNTPTATRTPTSTSTPTPTPSGNNYYVSPDGDDNNPGTEAHPWRTIQKAANTLVAGDTVYVKAGTYQERVIPQNSGTAGNYIMYAAYPGHTVTIDGASIIVPEWGGLFDIAAKSYIRVSGLRMMNAGPNLHNPGILVDGSSHIIIENNYVYHTSDSGIGVWSSDNVIVDHNEVELACYNGYNEGISVGGTDTFEIKNNNVHHSQKEGITAKDGSSNGKVFHNHVHHTDAVGIYVDAWDKYTYNIEVFENVVHDIAANGFALASEQGGLLENIKVYNNVAYNNKWCGVHLHACCTGNHPVRAVKIINNTFYDNGWDPWGGGILVENTDVQNVVIRNNICSQNLSFQIAVDANVPAGNVTTDHNLIDGYRGDEGEIYGSDYVEGDPMFVNAAGADFHLQENSPAIDQGSPADAPGDDFEGHARPYGAGYDIGADEFTLHGDLDYDCDVDVADIMQVASRWHCQCGDACYDSRYDLDGDCDIDIVDIMKVAAHWGETCGKQ